MREEYELAEGQLTQYENRARQPRSPTRPLTMLSSTGTEALESLATGTEDSVIEGLNRRTVLKLDLILLPFVSLLFLLNSLDRSNIGNAETANFTKDAGLQPEDLNIAVACFFAVFVLLQPVGAAFGRKFGMTRWVPGCMSLWGLCTAAHVLIRRKWELITVRIVIGILEGKRIYILSWLPMDGT